MDVSVALLGVGIRPSPGLPMPAMNLIRLFSPLLHPICLEDSQLCVNHSQNLPPAAAGTVPKSPAVS